MNHSFTSSNLNNLLVMERQRSFSLKPTRCLFFSFTLCSSLIFFTCFTIWVIKSTPLVRQQIHLNFNKSLNLGSSPINVKTLIDFGRNLTKTDVKNPIFSHNPQTQPKGFSGFENITVLEEFRSEYEVLEDGRYDGETSISDDLKGMQEGYNGTSFGNKSKVAVNGSREEKIKEVKGSVENIGVSRREDKKTTGASISIREEVEQNREKDCDLTKGSWVFDESYPLYTRYSCPFIDEGFDCEGNGRLDKAYMKWRWQPHDCDLPRFNATNMLQLIRGKRLVFVGDSINRNQWESMLCMLMGAIKDPKRVHETHGRKITKEKGNYSFKFLDYQCTVEYYVSHFLVHESKAKIGQKRKPTLRIDAVDRHSSRWRGADILIFNTAHWWSHYKTKSGINYYQEGNVVYPKLDVSTAFRKALTTWALWVEKHVNPRKTKVFFRSSAPSHFRGGQWNSGGQCKDSTQPLNETFSNGYLDKNVITEEVIKQMKTPVTFLNITSLSEYRIDGHPSVYGRNSDKRKSSPIQDCSHWCLPGIPDSWNELLLFHLHYR